MQDTMPRMTPEHPVWSFFNVLDFGAIGDGHTLNTTAIQATIESCSQSGGGTVYVPAGVYRTGSIFLQSNITLHLDAGATLQGSEQMADFPLIDSRWEGVNRKTHAPLVAGSHLNNIAVTGRGTIDGCGAHWWEKHRAKMLEHPRPRLISFFHCHNVLIEGVTLTNSPSWTINPVYCENVTVDKVTIVNPSDSPNTDGINPDSCRNVHIANCHVDVGDDCISIKSGTEDDHRAMLSPCENITITNCTMVHGHGGVVIGSETSGGIRNVVISNCIFKGTDRGIRIKSRRGRGGMVEDIRVANVVMENVLCPFVMNLFYGCGAWGAQRISDKTPYPVTEGTPRFRRIHFNSITAREVQYAAAFIYGLPEMPVEEISFSDISVSMALDAGAGNPAMAPDMEPMQRAGFFACNVQGLRFHNVELTNQQGAAFCLSDATNVEVSACTSRTPGVDSPLISLRNVDGTFIHGCQTPPGTSIFVQLEGVNTKGVVLSNNDLAQARQPIQLIDNVPDDAVLRA